MVAPINTVKHYVHLGNAAIANGAILDYVIANAVVAPATGNAFDVREGSVIKAVHIEVWCMGAGATGEDTQFTAILYKNPSGATPITFAQSSNLGAYPNKKNILYTTQGVVGTFIDGTNPIPIIRQWFAIPKGKQRMGSDDSIRVAIASTGTILQRCGLSTYKEYV